LEVIVVDDGSSDETAVVVAAAGATCLRQANAGPAAARELGWRSSGGSRIVFVDDDCVLEPDALCLLAAALDDAEGVGANIVPMERSSLVADFVNLEGLVNHRVVDGRIRWLVTAAVAYRRDALECIGGFDRRFPRATGEDVDLTLRLLENGGRLRVLPEAIVYHDHRARMSDLVRTYYRHGTAQRLLSTKHAVHRGDNYRTAVERLKLAAWLRTYRGYRREASIGRSLVFVTLRAAMMVPYAAGAIMGERKPATTTP
jgi:GT2 family glycosyltransferase